MHPNQSVESLKSANDPLAAIRHMVLADSMLQARLGKVDDPEVFKGLLLSAVLSSGLDCDDAILSHALRPDPLGIGRWAPAPVNPSGWPPPGWLPSRSLATADGLAFDWAWFGNHPLDQPFYEDSVRRAANLPLSQLLRARTSLAELVTGWQDQADPVTPAGLIFHMSRCGSTLLARMLQNLPGCYAASEPEPFDAVVQWAWRASVDTKAKIAALRAIAAALGRNIAVDGAHFFIKLDCWHIFSLPLLRAAFPDTPWVFLYRDPLEVAVSQLAMPGVHVVPGMVGSDMTGIAGGETMPAVDYCARVLGGICDAAAQHALLGGGLFVEYPDLISAMQASIPEHFGITLDPQARTLIAALTSTNAKHPGQMFVSDSDGKRKAALPNLISAIDAFTRPSYRKLQNSP